MRGWIIQRPESAAAGAAAGRFMMMKLRVRLLAGFTAGMLLVSAGPGAGITSHAESGADIVALSETTPPIESVNPIFRVPAVGAAKNTFGTEKVSGVKNVSGLDDASGGVKVESLGTNGAGQSNLPEGGEKSTSEGPIIQSEGGAESAATGKAEEAPGRAKIHVNYGRGDGIEDMEAPEQAESDDVAVSEQAEKEETAAPKQVEKEETAVPEQAEKEETGTAKAAEQAIPDQNDAGRSGAADSSVDTDTAANGEREEDSADVEEENPEEDEGSGTVRRSGVLRAPRRAPQAVGWERMLETGPQFAADVAALTAPSEIRGLMISADAPAGAATVDVGLRHVHEDSCRHVHGDGCWSTPECVSDGQVTHIEEFDNNVEGYTDRPIGWWYYTHCKYCGTELICKNLGVRRAYDNGEKVPGTHCSSDQNPNRTLTCSIRDDQPVCGMTEETHIAHIDAWAEDHILYLYSPQNPGADLCLNPDSSRMFADMSGLVSLDLTHFDGSSLQDTTAMFPEGLEALTLGNRFRFSDSSGTYATEGSGLVGAWEKDGEEITDGESAAPFKTQKTFNTTLLSGTFEGRWNQHADDWAGTWVRQEVTHQYFARGQAATTPGGNAWEEHSADKRFYGYCFAQHLAPPDGPYNKILVDDPAILTEILHGQQYQSSPAADNIRDAIITVLYFGYPNGQQLSGDQNIQAKYGLSDEAYSLVTWNVLCHYSDGYSRRGNFSGRQREAYDALFGCTYGSIPASLRQEIHLYLYVSQRHQQHMVAMDGITYQQYGGVSVKKVDSTSGAALMGAAFTIYDAAGNAVDADRSTPEIDPIVSGSDGIACLCRCDERSGLAPGTYTIRETRAPDGYDLCTEEYTFTVRLSGVITQTGVSSRTGLREKMVFRDDPVVVKHAGGIRMRKVDAEHPEIGILGGTFGIYAAEDITASSADGNRTVTLYAADDPVTTLTGGPDGRAETAENALQLGKYYLKEVEAPAGYQKNDEIFPFSVTAENRFQDQEIVIPDVAKTGEAKLEFHKKLEGGLHPIPEKGFSFDLYRVAFTEDASGGSAQRTLVGTAVCDESGTVVFDSSNTGGALTFSGTGDLGQANFICVERTDAAYSEQFPALAAADRYVCDTHEESVSLAISDDGETEHLAVVPFYGGTSAALAGVGVYDTEEKIAENYRPAGFLNVYREPPALPDPVKKVSGGTTVKQDLHNQVKFGEVFQYDILQEIPAELPADQFRSFTLRDELPEGIAVTAVRVLAGGEDVTEKFRFTIRNHGIAVTGIEMGQAAEDTAAVQSQAEQASTPHTEKAVFTSMLWTEDEDSMAQSEKTASPTGRIQPVVPARTPSYTVLAEYSGDLSDPAVYGKIYDFRFTVRALGEAETKQSYFNAARVDIAYLEPENHLTAREDGKNVYETGLPDQEERTHDPEKAVHSRMTNSVQTDVWPCIPDFAWTVGKTVLDEDGEACNLWAVHSGDVLTYRITAQNLLHRISGSITVTDPLPAHVAFLDAEKGGVYDQKSGVITWKNLPFRAGETVSVSFRVRVLEEKAPGDIDNQATAVSCPDCAVRQQGETEENRGEQNETKQEEGNQSGPEEKEGQNEKPGESGPEERMPDLSVTKQTEIMHNFVPQIAKAVTDGSGTNVHGVLFEEGTELTYHLYVFNSDTAGENPKRDGTHRITVTDAVPENTELVSAAGSGRVIREMPDVGALAVDDAHCAALENIADGDGKKQVTWTETFAPREVREYVFRVRLKGRGTTARNIGIMTVPTPETASGEKKENGEETGAGQEKENGEETGAGKEKESGEGMEASRSTPKAVEFHSNEVVNGTIQDPVKQVQTLGGKDVHDAMLQVGDLYRYAVTVANPAAGEKYFVVTDEVTELVDLVDVEIDGKKVEVAKRGSTKAETDGAERTIAKTAGAEQPAAAGGVKEAIVKVADTRAAEAAAGLSDAVAVEGRRITAAVTVPAGTSRVISFTFRPNRKESVFTNQAHVCLTGNVPLRPETGELIEGGADHPAERDTNEVRNWTPRDPEKTVSRTYASTGEIQNMDGAVVFGENGDTLEYAVKIANTSELVKTFTVKDPLDQDLEFVDAADGGSWQKEKRTVVWKSELTPGETKILHFRARVTGGSRNAHAENLAVMEVDEAHPSGNTTDTPIDVTPSKVVTNADGEDIDDFLVNKGDELVYVITVHNPAADTRQFRVTDKIPDNTSFVSMQSGRSVSPSHRADASLVNTVTRRSGNREIIWVSDIPAGEDYEFVFRVRAAKAGCYIPNSALVTVDRSTIRTNLVENWTPEAPLKAVTAGGRNAQGQTFQAGDGTELIYSITVKNPANTAKIFSVTDRLDRNLRFLSAEDGGTFDGTAVRFEAKVGAGATKVLSFRVKIVDTPVGKEIPNKAQISCDSFGAETNTVTVYVEKAVKTAAKPSAVSEDITVTPGGRKAPSTGDTAGAWELGLVLAALAAGFAAAVYLLKRKKG